jgi:hypothetical protein
LPGEKREDKNCGSIGGDVKSETEIMFGNLFYFVIFFVTSKFFSVLDITYKEFYHSVIQSSLNNTLKADASGEKERKKDQTQLRNIIFAGA